MIKVFLGGTCANSKWREELIPKLNIDFFNPVVEDWTSECMAEELKQREICDYVLYTITQVASTYSIAEVVDSSNKRPGRTLFCLLKDGLDEQEAKHLQAVANLVERNGAIVLYSLNEVADFFKYN